MTLFKFAALAILALSVSACATVETATRNAPLDAPLAGAPTTVERSYAVQDVRVSVPPSLRVSERNGYYPMTDIVWRGDPIGDRHGQIAAIFETAAARDAETLQGAVPVVADVELQRFHGVTERTRYSVGGVYSIEFILTVRDAVTGAIIEGPRAVKADLPAPGGMAAILADQRGQTEKVRVTDHLAYVLRRELGPRVGPVAPTLSPTLVASR